MLEKRRVENRVVLLRKEKENSSHREEEKRRSGRKSRRLKKDTEKTQRMKRTLEKQRETGDSKINPPGGRRDAGSGDETWGRETKKRRGKGMQQQQQ